MCCDGNGELGVQPFHLSQFHGVSMFGLLLIGARTAQVMALACLDVSCYQSNCVGLDEIVGVFNEYKRIRFQHV